MLISSLLEGVVREKEYSVVRQYVCSIGCPPQRANTPTGWFFKEVSFLNRKGGPTLRCPLIRINDGLSSRRSPIVSATLDRRMQQVSVRCHTDKQGRYGTVDH
jgi:hypothetical protein